MKKKFVFQKDDVVYHSVYGRGVVRNVDDSGIPYLVKYDEDGRSSWTSDEQMLSFEPWPKPVHVRPFQAGWWIAKSRGGADLRIVYSTSKTGGLIYCHYLGEKLPEEWNTEKGIV